MRTLVLIVLANSVRYPTSLRSQVSGYSVFLGRLTEWEYPVVCVRAKHLRPDPIDSQVNQDDRERIR